MTHQDIPGWPPDPAQVWLVHGTMGAPIASMDDDGGDRAVLLRIGARRNQDDTQSDMTYVLDLDRVAAIMAGLLDTANIAFGRQAVQAAMAANLGVSPGLRDATIAAVDKALDGVGPDHR